MGSRQQQIMPGKAKILRFRLRRRPEHAEGMTGLYWRIAGEATGPGPSPGTGSDCAKQTQFAARAGSEEPIMSNKANLPWRGLSAPAVGLRSR